MNSYIRNISNGILETSKWMTYPIQRWGRARVVSLGIAGLAVIVVIVYLFRKRGPTTLVLSHQRLTSLVNLVPHSTLKIIDVAHNQLTTLPDSIGRFTSLEMIDLSYNHIISLPDSFGNLLSLEILDLSHNKLSTLPGSICKLIRLRILNLSFNTLTTLPEALSQITTLEELYLSDNPLDTLPLTVQKMPSLKWLVLNNTPLTDLSFPNTRILSKAKAKKQHRLSWAEPTRENT